MADLFLNAPIPIEAQIACVERELKQRAHVYPRRVAEGKMSQAFADEQVRAMEAVLATLRRVESAA